MAGLTTGLSLNEVLKDQEHIDEDAAMLLGSSDPDSCSYSKGYVKRQALAVCKTCNPPNCHTNLAGVCLACGLTCHQGHDVITLFTKRKFRCDCGNFNNGSNVCKLEPKKEKHNIHNNYNQNFLGTQCYCHGEFIESKEISENLQCTICEDWFHIEHVCQEMQLENEQIKCLEFICQNCLDEHSFLGHYHEFARIPKQTVVPLILENELPADPNTSDLGTDCKLQTRKSVKFDTTTGAFFKKEYRDNLCQCIKCVEQYADEKVSFLLDEEDRLDFYEKHGKRKVCDTIQSEENAVSKRLMNCSAVQKSEVIHGMNFLANELHELLSASNSGDREITVDAVNEFTEKLRQDGIERRRQLSKESSNCNQ